MGLTLLTLNHDRIIVLSSTHLIVRPEHVPPLPLTLAEAPRTLRQDVCHSLVYSVRIDMPSVRLTRRRYHVTRSGSFASAWAAS